MELEHLLLHSLKQYRQLLEQMNDIGHMLKSGRGADIGEALERWTQFHEEARQTDDQIGAFCKQDPEAARSAPPFAERQALLEDLAALCRELFGQARTHQALIRDELARLRGGRQAMNGYKQPPAESGYRRGTSY